MRGASSIQILRIATQFLDGTRHRIVSYPASCLTLKLLTAVRSRNAVALCQYEYGHTILRVELDSLTSSLGGSRDIVGNQLDHSDLRQELLTLGGILLRSERSVQILRSLVIITLLLERLSQVDSHLGRRLNSIRLLGYLEVEIARTLGTRHQRNSLAEHLGIIGRIGQLTTEERLQILAVGSLTHTEGSIELILILGITLQHRSQTVVLGNHLLGHHLIRILVILTQIREINHDRLGLRLCTTGLDSGAESLTDGRAVRLEEVQHITRLHIQDIDLTLLRIVTEVLDTLVVNHHQRIDHRLTLGHRRSTSCLVTIDDHTILVDVHRSGRTISQQRLEIAGGRVVVLVCNSLLEEVTVQDVLLTLLGRITPTSIARVTKILLCHRRHSHQREGCRQEKLHFFHHVCCLVI